MCLNSSKEIHMADRDEILRTHTFKDEGFPVGQRVFYSLHTEDKNLQAARNTKAISLLVERLHEKGIIGEEELDELLLQVTYH
jgi:hypothetical protein